MFTQSRRCSLEHREGQALFVEVVWEADRQGLLSDEHLSVDGTLIDAVSCIKSFTRRDEERQPPDDEGNAKLRSGVIQGGVTGDLRDTFS